MIRTYIKLCRKNLLKYGLLQQKNLLINRRFIHHPATSGLKIIPPVLSVHCQNTQSLRLKSRSSKNKQESDSESDANQQDEFADNIQDKHTKIVNINVTSLRADSILKSGLGMARNKIETLFYESKIRINGQKISKKSAPVQVGDEIDLVKGPDLKNPNFINVARVEVLSVKPGEDEESISVKIRRCKSLTVESY